MLPTTEPTHSGFSHGQLQGYAADYLRALSGIYEADLFISPPAGKKWGPHTPVNWNVTSGTTGDTPRIRGGFVCRSEHSAQNFTTCGVGSSLSFIPPTGGALLIETGVLGGSGSDAASFQAGLVSSAPANGLVAADYGWYLTNTAVQFKYVLPVAGTTNALGATGVITPACGLRLALVRWDATQFSWFRQIDPAAPRMVELFSLSIAAWAAANVYPTAQLWSRTSGLSACISNFQ